jgi:sterol O-acyltransferase
MHRTARVRWYEVFINFAQVVGAVLYTNYIFVRFCIPVFKHFNTEHVSLKMFAHSILNCTLPGTLLLLVGFFAFLHCWLNAFAEMLRFADRMFYKDWWNSTNFSNYYRTVSKRHAILAGQQLNNLNSNYLYLL